MRALITATEVGSLSRPCYADEAILVALIQEAEREDIKPRIGDALYLALKDGAEASLSDKYKLLLNGGSWTDKSGSTRYLDGLKTALAYFVYARVVRDGNITSTRYGSRIKSDDNSLEAETEERQRQYRQAFSSADALLVDCLALINEYPEDYNIVTSASLKSNRTKFKVVGSECPHQDGRRSSNPTIIAGKEGASAYEIAVSHGYRGTEAEWLVSLHGADGESLYDILKNEGYFSGSYSEFVTYMTTSFNSLSTLESSTRATLTQATSVVASTLEAKRLAEVATNSVREKEASVESAEALRVIAERARVSAETSRASAENERTTAESARSTAESGRSSAEQTRVNNENARMANETARQSAEQTRQSTFESGEQTRSNTFSASEQSRSSSFSTNEAARKATFDSKEAARDAATATIAQEATKLTNLESKVNAFGIDYINEDVANAYDTLTTTANIPIGTKLINNGSVWLLLADNATLTNRKDLSVGEEWTSTFVVNVIKGGRVGHAQLISRGTIDNRINDAVLDTDNLSDKCVTAQKTSFIRTINLVNDADENYKRGYFVGTDGNVNANNSYNASGFIPVKSGITYYASNGLTFRFVTMYNSDKNVVFSKGLVNVASFVCPNDISYVRVTCYTGHIAQMTEGASYDETPYHIEMDDTYIPNSVLNGLANIPVNQFLLGLTPITLNVQGYYDYNLPFTIPSGSIIRASSVGFYANYSVSGTQRRIQVGEDTYIDYDLNSIRPFSTGGSTIELSIYGRKYNGEAPRVFLPKKIYVATGRTIELYYDQVVLNAHKYNIKATCQKGISLERKFQFVGSASLVGREYAFDLYVYNDNGEMMAHKSSTIYFVSNTIATSKTLIPFGDSLTNGKVWLSEVNELSANKLSFIGTMISDNGLAHEGRSGMRASFYNSTDVTQQYTFSHTYNGVGKDASNFSASTSYSVGDYCKYNNKVYVFKNAHSGAWNASDVFNLSDSNPFINWQNGAWSFSAYKTRNGYNPDAIVLFLGTNGINLTPSTNADGVVGIKGIVDRIRLEDANIPIVIVNTLFKSGQNGIGRQGNTDGYSASQSAYKFEEDLKVLLLAEALDNALSSYANVYFAPCGFTMDSEYCYGNNLASVNPRLTDTSVVRELLPIDSTHPQECGYMQIADELFSVLCKVFA